ncbi:ABC transporter permease [Dactylosporangium fulvum]|uniref:ABC transporter permease n=1 Tax=Dactylosporangium fulvum TaxID=53359 RepID=A0ABY5VRE7_9ACTN|nr:ABC transporter permease [Dactylosporangium fulvum]UWP79719.1 ABC transporter permease [Dactylosporangium fulvum]
MSRLAAGDVLRLGAVGLRSRPSRAALSALGIAIGIAAMLAVVGISGSGRADLRQTLDSLGTNLLRVSATDHAVLPDGAVGMIERIGPVTGATALRKLPDDVHVYRNDRVPAQQTNGILPFAVDLDLTETVGATVARGAWLNPATADFPAVVLGAESARRLGITTPDPRMVVRVGGEGFTVVGILAPVTLLPELDSAALIGTSAARTYLGTAAHPTTIYLRAADAQVTAVRDVLASTANPAAPYEVAVSRPSDALAARLATERAFNGLLLGLGAVALLVGGVGVANTMVITVLERRAEIGLRRSLGATRGQIRLQFLTEAAVLSTLGGVTGVVLGTLITAAYAVSRSWPIALPAWAVPAGIGATVVVGAVAGLYPAVRAARLAPTEALTAV